MADVDRFAVFVSSVEGQPFTRYGTRTLIGAERSRTEPTRIDYRPEQVVGIPHSEFNRYRREYQRGLGNGSLRARKPSEWLAQQAPPTPSIQREGTPSAPETAAAPVAAAPPSAGEVNADPSSST